MRSSMPRFPLGGSIAKATGVLFTLSCVSGAAQSIQPTGPLSPPPTPASTVASTPTRPERAKSPAPTMVITRAQLAERASGRISRAVAGIPGVRLVPDATGWAAASTRIPGCATQVIVDRVLMTAPGIESSFSIDDIPVESVERIEFYAGVATIPVGLPVRNPRCGVLVIHTLRR